MRPPPSPHSNFFSSLKQVEKRLKLEDTSKPTTLSVASQSQTSINLATGSLSSPLYLHVDQSHSLSEQQQQQQQQQQQPFLSSTSSQFPQTQQSNDLLLLHDQPKTVFHTQHQEAIDDIQRLIQLLGLSDCYCNGDDKEEEEEGERESQKRVGNSCDYDEGENGFYAKIVGVKGPKCGKEVERLEGWIQYFMNGEMERREPLRLAYLLLGKAAIENKEDADCGYGGLDFPTSVHQFLLNDPPTD